MTFERFCVVFDNPQAVYSPGQTVSGKVEFWTNKPKKSTGVYLFASGEAKVDWTDKGKATEILSEKQKKTKKEKHYSASEEYLQHRSTLLSSEGGVQFEIAAGRHEYSFRFRLPEQLPSSFEGQFGCVRYAVTATIERPGKKNNYECNKSFVVNSICDLNAIAGASSEVRGSDRQMSGYWMLKTGPVSGRAWIDRAGYVPGEKVLFSAEIENGSGRDISMSKIALIEYATFHSRLMSKTATRQLYEMRRGSNGGREVWTNVPIVVPPVVPSDLPHCKIIDVTYQLVLTVKFGHLSSKLRIPLDIIIGTVPLRHQAAEGECTILGVPIGPPSAPPVPAPRARRQTSDIPPPSYTDCLASAAANEIEDEHHVMETKDETIAAL